MFSFRPYSPPVTSLESLLNTELTKKQRISFGDQVSVFERQEVRMTIRPEPNTRMTIGQQLHNLISRPPPAIFRETKRIGFMDHKMTFSRSREKSQKKECQEQKQKLLQQISEKLNTNNFGKQPEKKNNKQKIKTKPSLRRGQLNPGTKMTFQTKPSFKVQETQKVDNQKQIRNNHFRDNPNSCIGDAYIVNTKTNFFCSKQVSVNKMNMEYSQRSDTNSYDKNYLFSPKTDTNRIELNRQHAKVIQKQQIKSSRIQIISNFIPLYGQVIFSPKKVQSSNCIFGQICQQNLRIKQEEICLNIQLKSQQKIQIVLDANTKTQFLEQPKKSKTNQNQFCSEPIPNAYQTNNQNQEEQEFEQIDFYQPYNKQQSVQKLEQIQLKQEQSQPLSLKSNQQIAFENIIWINDANLILNTKQQITSATQQIKQKLVSQTQPQEQLVISQSQKSLKSFEQSIINTFNLDNSKQTQIQSAKQDNLQIQEESDSKENVEEGQSKEDDFALLERFIKQNQDKFNRNNIQTNVRREMMKDIEAFWSSSTIQSEQQQQNLEQSDTKTIDLPITQQDITINNQNEVSPIDSSQASITSDLKIQDFVKGKRLGKGMFGQVFIVQHIKTGFMCALKCLKKQFIRAQKMTEQLLQELKIHSSLSHPNIVQIYGYFADEQNIYVLQELCTGGQLFDLIVKRRRISEKRTAYYIKQLSQGLRYLQTASIVHRDIKPQNILLQEGVVKICDFGWATFTLQNKLSQKCGTPLYMSPEMVKGDTTYSDKVDVWGLGLIAYELIIGNIPWNIWTQEDTSKIVTDDLTFPSYVSISSRAEDFIRKALTKDPEERISLLQSFTHDFLIDVNPMQYQNQTFQSYGQATPDTF